MNRDRLATIAAALAIVLAALLVAGCGSSSSDPITKAEFVKQGNEICKEASKEREEDLEAATDESGEGEEIANYVEVALGSIENMASELSGLEPPAAQKKQSEKLVQELEGEIEALQASPEKPITSSSFKDANAAAEQAGLPACTI